MAIKKGTLDELLSGRDPKQVFSKDGLFDELKKALAERVLNAELDEHLDGEAAAGKANHRNGYSKNAPEGLFAKMAASAPRRRLQPGGSRRQPVRLARLPPSQWKSARTTNAIEHLHEEFKRRIKTQTILPSAESAAMLFLALLAWGQIQ